MAPSLPDQNVMPAARLRGGRMARALSWLSAIILVLQLLGTSNHHHDLKRHADCASCVLIAQLQSPPSVPGIVHQLVRAASLQYLLAALVVATVVAGISKPIPRAQGPPTHHAY